jgi:hypothetical protein
MSISSIEIPLTYYNISSYYNNNVFSIQVLDTPLEIDGTPPPAPTIIELSAGLYEARNSSSSRVSAYSIEQEINDKITAINTPISTVSQNPYHSYINNVEFVIDKRSGYSYFRYKNNVDIKTYKIKINFNLNNQDAISKNCHSNDLHKKLGWQLGFRTDSITLSSSNLIANSSAICNISYPRYIYIAIDDFQSSSQNYFAVASDSIIAPNIITRINILSLLEEKTAFKQGAYAGDIYYNQKHIREYFGPTDINKLKIQLLDEYGRNFSLNNMDWSFIITFDCLYN